MGHKVSLFIATPSVLGAFRRACPVAMAFRLGRRPDLAALPLTEDVLDRLHASYGTGEWLSTGAMLTTTDLELAARASRAGPLAYVETDYFGGEGGQAAILWRGGERVLGPAAIRAESEHARPRQFWPINAALRGFGIAAAPGLDEFDTLGLGEYRSNEALMAAARPVDS